jgi:hypothetical protein
MAEHQGSSGDTETALVNRKPAHKFKKKNRTTKNGMIVKLTSVTSTKGKGELSITERFLSLAVSTCNIKEYIIIT